MLLRCPCEGTAPSPRIVDTEGYREVDGGCSVMMWAWEQSADTLCVLPKEVWSPPPIDKGTTVTLSVCGTAK